MIHARARALRRALSRALAHGLDRALAHGRARVPGCARVPGRARSLGLGLGVAIVVAAANAASPGPRLAFDSRVVWTEDSPRFGGFSAIEVQPDGVGFVAISDRGRWATGRLLREDGRLDGVEMTGAGRLHGIDGAPLEAAEADAEGVAVDAEGRTYVSFEGFHRIRRYDRIDGPAARVPSHPDFKKMQRNSSLEALAVDAEGAIYTIPERSGAWERPFPVYRLRDGVWDRTMSIPRVGRFLVSGADFGPDGRLYILERDFAWYTGFSTRVRRFEIGPDGIDRGVTLLETGPGSADNFEGISVWRGPGGETRVTLIADDNFFALQSTAIAEYVVVE